MSYTTDTRTAAVQYGKAYLDDAQLAAQQARVKAIESGTVLYGVKYRPEPAELTPTTPDVPEAPALLTVAQLKERGKTATADEVIAWLSLEVNRVGGPRKVALMELQAACTRLGMTDRAEQIAAVLTEPEG